MFLFVVVMPTWQQCSDLYCLLSCRFCYRGYHSTLREQIFHPIGLVGGVGRERECEAACRTGADWYVLRAGGSPSIIYSNEDENIRQNVTDR